MPQSKDELEADKIVREIKKDVSHIEETVKEAKFKKQHKKEQ